MRQIGTLSSEQDAHRFADYLLTEGISAQVDKGPSEWTIWVRNEDQVSAAREKLDHFSQHPTDAKYDGVSTRARNVRAATERRQDQARRNVIELGSRWRAPLSQRAPLSAFLIAICVGVFLLDGLLSGAPFSRALSFVDARASRWMEMPGSIDRANREDREWDPVAAIDPWFSIRRGQLWRLITPIFLHANILHLLFNMSAVYYLVGQVESRRGTPWMVGFLLVSAALSNTAQAVAVGPNFVGISGVVYAVFGYMWIQLWYDPHCGFLLSRDFVIIALLFLFLGFLGQSRLNFANFAHAGGLVTGMILGGIPYWRPKSNGRESRRK